MPNNLHAMVLHQLENFFGLTGDEKSALGSLIDQASARCLVTFKRIKNKYYQGNHSSVDPLHSSQYAMFLYHLAKGASSSPDMQRLADKVYYLNKSLNNCELYHVIDLPDLMYFDHPLGSIMGRANYSNYFAFQQGCCVGNNHDAYPTFGEHVRMFANSTVIGASTIGTRVFISANTYIKDQDIPDNSLVFGSPPDLKIVTKPNDYFDDRSPFLL